MNDVALGDIESFTANSDLPLLQSTLEANWWDDWQVFYRDVIILDRDGMRAEVFNLTDHDLWEEEEFEALKTILLTIAEDSE